MSMPGRASYVSGYGPPGGQGPAPPYTSTTPFAPTPNPQQQFFNGIPNPHPQVLQPGNAAAYNASQPLYLSPGNTSRPTAPMSSALTLHTNPGAPIPSQSRPGTAGPGAMPGRTEPPPLSSTAAPHGMPGTLTNPIAGPRKRLIITCDGTWVDVDASNPKDGRPAPPSNVARIGWALKPSSRDGIPQVVNYQAGVGTHGGPITKSLGGSLGVGIKENIREAYTYIATNWRPGDEIFLIGFSRGAFTARSVGNAIAQLGILTRTGLPYFSEIFEDLQHADDSRYQPALPDIPFRDKPPFGPEYVHTLAKLNLTQPQVRIRAICVFDTVGSLGIPRLPIISSLNTRARRLKEYQFSDTKISPLVDNAYQALSLDEHRAPFSPAVWELDPSNHTTNLKQVWFPGVHTNIGGGYPDAELSNITLAWMISRLEPLLDFRLDFLDEVHNDLRSYYRDTDQRTRKWAMGEIYKSFKGATSLLGSRTRTPGNYTKVDPYTGKETGRPLRGTNEYIHPSVRARVGLGGPGTDNRGPYSPRGLGEWSFEQQVIRSGGFNGPPGQQGQRMNGNMNTMPPYDPRAPAGHLPNDPNGGPATRFVWIYRGSKQLEGQTEIPEIGLLPTEYKLLGFSPDVEQYVRFMRMPEKKSRRDRDGNRKRYHGDDDRRRSRMDHGNSNGERTNGTAMMNGGLGPGDPRYSTANGMGMIDNRNRRRETMPPQSYNPAYNDGRNANETNNGDDRRRHSRRSRAASLGGGGRNRDLPDEYADDDDNNSPRTSRRYQGTPRDRDRDRERDRDGREDDERDRGGGRRRSKSVNRSSNANLNNSNLAPGIGRDRSRSQVANNNNNDGGGGGTGTGRRERRSGRGDRDDVVSNDSRDTWEKDASDEEEGVADVNRNNNRRRMSSRY